MMRVSLQGERGGRVTCEGLQVADGLAALDEQRQAAVPEIVEADGGRPARPSSGLKCRFTTFCASSGVPLLVAKPSPESS